MEIVNELSQVRRKQSITNKGLYSYFSDSEKIERVKRVSGDRKRSKENTVFQTLKKIDNCGSFLHLREWLEHDGQVTVKNANFCKQHLMCNCCAIRRTAKTIGKYGPIIEKVIEDHSKEGFELIPVMLTFTVKNGENLLHTTNHLRDSWTMMREETRQSKLEKRGYTSNEFNKVLGYVKAMEVTNKGNGWHPHFHVFALLSEYIDQKQISKEWNRYTGDSFIVGVTEIPEIDKGLYEVLKYATKFGDLTPAQIAEVWATLRGSRFVDSGGILRGVKGVEDLTDEDLTGEYREYYAYWVKKAAEYVVYDVPRYHREVVPLSKEKMAGMRD